MKNHLLVLLEVIRGQRWLVNTEVIEAVKAMDACLSKLEAENKSLREENARLTNENAEVHQVRKEAACMQEMLEAAEDKLGAIRGILKGEA